MATPHICPVCNGYGTTNKPSHIAGDQQLWSSGNATIYKCHACKGKGIVWENNEKEYVYPEYVYISLGEWR